MHRKIYLSIFFLFIGVHGFTQSPVLKFRHLDVNNGLPQSSVYSIEKDKFGFMWFGTWGGAVRYDGYTTKVFRPIENDHAALSDYRISCIVTDANQDVWIETENRKAYYKYDYGTETFKRYEKQQLPRHVSQKVRMWHQVFYKQTGNEVFEWTTTQNGLQQRNKKTGETYIYRSALNNPFALSDNVTKNVLLDEQQNLWVGTQSGGVSYTSIYDKPFNSHYVGQNGNGLVENSVRAITTDQKGRIWAGSENRGITIIDPSVKNASYHHLNQDRLKNAQVRAIYCDNQNKLWIGTKSGLFVVTDGKELIKPAYDKSKLNDKIFAIAADNRKNLWIGTLDGLVLYDQQQLKFKRLLTDKKLMGKYIRCIVHDDQNGTWVATEDKGVTYLKPRFSRSRETTYQITNYLHNPENDKSLGANRTYSLTIDKHKKVWVATDRGISIIDPLNRQIRNFTVKDGLPDDLTMGVAYDGEKSIWISHKKGLSKINIDDYKLQHFDVTDGLQGNEFNQSACYFDTRSRTMLFGGTNGLTSFRPREIKLNPYAPQLVFTGLNIMHEPVNIGKPVNGRVVLEKSLLCTDSITLTWWDKVFEIEFAALHFGNSWGNRYKYMLEGFDKNWIETDARDRKAAYANLPSGSYRLKVLASNSDGVWAKHPKILHVEVVSPWWSSSLAIIVYVIIALAILWLIVNSIISRIKLRENQKLHQAKLRFFTGVSHEFRTPLTLIVDPLEKLLKDKPSPAITKQYYELMQRNAKQLLTLVNQLLDFNKLESGHFSLNLKGLELISFVKGLVDAFNLQAQAKEIHLELLTDIPELWLDFDEQKLNIIMNNLLSNAIKFTPPQGNITVQINYQDIARSMIAISISDSGVGLSAEEMKRIFDLFYQAEGPSQNQLGSGIGLALTKELVELHGGQISVKSKENAGSIFTVIFPLKKHLAQVKNFTEGEGKVEAAPVQRASDGIEEEEKPVVLFVDDNKDIRKYFELNFSDRYSLCFAANGKEGLAKALAQMPDIIISDMMMPDMDGLTFCNHIKNNKITSHIPFLLLTAKQSDEAKTEGYQTGADAYLTKPFSTNVLQARINNLLTQRKLLRDLFDQQFTIHQRETASTNAQQLFLNEVRQLINTNLENEKFNVDFLAEQIGMSRSQFYRKMKALTNQSINEFVLETQMKKAEAYLVSGKYNVSEVAYKVGYHSPNSFTRAFVKHFGITPSQYLDHGNQR